MTTPQLFRSIRPTDALERAFGSFGGVELRGGIALLSELPLAEARIANDGAGVMTVKGHASVFDRMSLDLGGFRERIAPGAFDQVLDGQPHTTLNWNHDDRWILGSTRAPDQQNGGLELQIDPVGLRFFSRVVHDPATLEPPSYAQDLRIAMGAGLVSQASFAFTVGDEEWLIDSQGNFTRTILRVEGLYDVCVCAMGAYPSTDSHLLRAALAQRALEHATKTGRLPADTDVRELIAHAFRVDLGATRDAAEDAPGAAGTTPPPEGDGDDGAARERALVVAQADARVRRARLRSGVIATEEV